jgi:hypothetical protein
MRGVNIYVSHYGTHLLAPDSPFLQQKLRKDGNLDLRYKVNLEVIRHENELGARIQAAYDRGEDVNAIMA